LIKKKEDSAPALPNIPCTAPEAIPITQLKATPIT
jgi:hypothetical protein